MNHTRVRDNLSAYLDGRLSARQAARVEAHLRDCPECRAELESLRATVALLKSLPDVPLPGNFTLSASAVKQQTGFRRLDVAFGALRGAAVAVALMFLLFVAGDAYMSVGRLAGTASPMMKQSADSATEMTAQPLAKQREALPEAAPIELAEAPAPEEEAPVASSMEVEAPMEEIEGVALTAEAENAEPQPEVAVEAVDREPPIKRSVAGAPSPKPSMPSAMGGGGEPPVAKAEPTVLPQPTAVVEAPTPTDVPRAQPSPTAIPSRVALLITPEVEAEPIPAAAPDRVAGASWSLWRLFRIGSGVLLGLLVALCGALLWVRARRRL